MKLPLGKVSPEILKSIVLEKSGSHSLKLLVKPKIGGNFSVVQLNSLFLLCTSDPITGVSKDIGWYAVNVSANDIATSGASPKFLQSVILLPEGSTESDLEKIAGDIDRAAKKIGISVTGGHTEIVKGLSSPIVTTTCYTITKKYITSADAKKGDAIIMTKTAGIEGTSIIAKSKKFSEGIPKSLLNKAAQQLNMISVVKEAILAFRTGLVHSMHDPTEGGVVGGLSEMAEASGIGFKIYREKIPIAEETKTICKIKKIDPLFLISSGSLLVSVDPAGKEKIIKTLELNGVQATEIGEFTESGRILVDEKGKENNISGSIIDELWKMEKSEI